MAEKTLLETSRGIYKMLGSKQMISVPHDLREKTIPLV